MREGHWESVQCWCYSCEEVAPCLLWGTGLHKTDHCNATVSSWLWLKNKVSIFPLIQPTAAICLHCVIPLLVLGVAATSNSPWKNEAVGSCPFVSLLEALVPTWIFQLKLFSSPITIQVQQNESSSVDEATAGGLMTTSVSARPSSMSGFSHGLYGPASFCSLPLCGSLEEADNCPLTLHEESADTDSCFPSCSPTSSIAFAHSRPRSDPSTDSQYVHTYMDTHSPSILFRFFHSQYSIIKEQQECIKVHACIRAHHVCANHNSFDYYKSCKILADGRRIWDVQLLWVWNNTHSFEDKILWQVLRRSDDSIRQILTRAFCTHMYNCSFHQISCTFLLLSCVVVLPHQEKPAIHIC